MCKCSFVRIACVALALVATAFAQQEYDVEEPNNSDVVFNRVRSADVSLIFNDKEVVVNPGEQLHLDCGVQGTYRYCFWETGRGATFQAQDVYENQYPGLSKPEITEGNECGIVINSVTIEQHGSWTCKVFVKGNSLAGTKNVIVTIKPTKPVLEVDTSRGVLQVSSEEESDVRCSVAAARPAVGIRWFLGDRDVTVFAETEETPTDEGGIYKSVSTLRRTFEPAENGLPLVCSITHQTLAAPENASIPISVIFKPVEKSLSTYYQIVPGSDYEVRFNFSANPPPTKVEWRYGESFQNTPFSIPVPGSSERYNTYLETLDNGLYTARLYITEFTEADANQRYLLVVANEIGETNYEVKLSMDEAPLDTLGGGAVAGIIIVVLIVVVAVVAAGYARYRQMFCFAPPPPADPEEGKDIKEEHDTESARGPNSTRAANLKNSIGKLTQVFKKPKKDQDTKLEEGIAGEEEKKKLTKEEKKKGSPKKKRSSPEKERTGEKKVVEKEKKVSKPKVPKKPTDKRAEHPEEKKVSEDTNVSKPAVGPKPTEKNKEVVYAELDLSKGDPDKKSDAKNEDKTEYAQIIGTVADNKEEEKKE